MKLFYVAITFILLAAAMSCEIINPPEEIPSYISVDSVVLNTNYSTQGSRVENITDAWVYVDDKLVGVFEIPFTVPVLASGQSEIEIFPGIKNNGIAAERLIYPFMNFYSDNVELTPAEILKITPHFSYKDVTFALLEDFEDLGIAFQVSEQSDTSIMLVTGPDAMEGNSMFFALDSVRDVFECRSTELFELPLAKAVYLEMSFKTTDYFTFGLFARKYSNGSSIEIRDPIITFNPTSEWKTIYIDLSDCINDNSDAFDFRLYYTCARSDDQENDTTRVYIDNVKLIYQQL
ncbi:MAG: hypothetical protein KBB11_08210 [Bacteroidales bacterium]|nr:hypothetical protein [Bacteroidales bacterium]HQP04468.1 hypothetical protein [Bacteroidales bacterium]